jgi:hypothetical protein
MHTPPRPHTLTEGPAQHASPAPLTRDESGATGTGLAGRHLTAHLASRMPKGRSAKQTEEWKEANPEVPESEMPKIGWDMMLSDASDVAWSAINKCNADSADVRARASERTCAATDALKLLAHDAMETKATVGKRPPSQRHAAERVATAWACQIDAATQRKAVPRGALPHSIAEATKHCKGFEADEELRDFYENPQGSKAARSRVELSLLHQRHSTAVAAHAALLNQWKWHTFRELLEEAEQKGGAGFTNEIFAGFKACAEGAKSAYQPSRPSRSRPYAR